MNFALTDEQEFLKEAARGALSRFKTVEAAREAMDGSELPDLWPTAQEAGWAGLLISEEHGGAELYVMEGMLVFAELGRVLAGVGLLGHLPATFLLQRGGIPGPEGGLAKVTTIKAAIEAGELLADTLGPSALDEGGWGKLVSDLPGLKSAGGTEEILRNMVGERVLGLPPEPRLDKGVPFSELRAKEREAAGAAS